MTTHVNLIDERWRPHTDIVGERLDDAYVLADLKSNQIYELNTTGMRLWQLLSDGADYATIRDRLLDEFDVAADALEADIARLAGELADAGLIVRVNDAAPPA